MQQLLHVHSKIKNYMNNIRIRKKLVYSYLFVVFLPVLVIGYLLTDTLRNQAIEHAVAQATNNMEKVKRQVEEALKIHEGVSNNLFFDKHLMEIVAKVYKDKTEIFHAYREYKTFTNYLDLYKDIADIQLYVNNETLLENWSIFRADSETMSAAWFQQGIAARGKNSWHFIANPTKNHEPYLSLVRQVYKLDMDYIGMLVISVKPEALYAILEQEPFDTFLYLDDGMIVTAKNRELIGKSIQQYLNVQDELPQDTEQPLSIQLEDKPAKLLVDSIKLETNIDSLHLVSVIPETLILQDANRVSFIAYVIVGLSLLASCALIFVFSSAMSKRIRELSYDIKKVSRGDLKHFSRIEGNDEIGQLSRHFNGMVSNIADLMQQVRKADETRHELELKQKEIRFKMLANQVNPHFLFNALETVRMKAHCNGQEEIADIVKSLGTLLRSNLEVGQAAVSFQSELELTRMYLEIQHFRFGAKLSYRLPNPAEIKDFKVLPLLLQPIVENAIIHGIERKLTAGLIDVTVSEDTEHFFVTVKDDGVGIKEEKLQQLMNTLADQEDDTGKRIGLRNVDQRMKLHYGPQYGLTILSKEGSGTTVILTFPKGE